MVTKEQILEVLGQVRDPGTGQDLVTMKMVEDLKMDDTSISFSLVLPSLSVSYKSELNFGLMELLLKHFPGMQPNIHFKTRLAQASTGSTVLPHVRNIIAVASGKGGVGKSTVAVNLALGLQSLGATVGILDADVYGPSIPTMLGLQGQRPKIQDLYGKSKIVPIEKDGLHVMSIGFIVEPEQAVVLRGPRLGGIIKQFVADTMWPALDYLIVDLPPGTGDVQLTLVQTVPITGVVMVTTPQEVALIDAVKAVNMFALPSVQVPILGVVENMSWFTPEELPNHKYPIFGSGGGKKLAKMSQSMLLGQVPLVMSIREGGDEGKPIVSQNDAATRQVFIEIAKNTARQTAIRNEMIAPTQIVAMQS